MEAKNINDSDEAELRKWKEIDKIVADVKSHVEDNLPELHQAYVDTLGTQKLTINITISHDKKNEEPTVKTDSKVSKSGGVTKRIGTVSGGQLSWLNPEG